MKKESISNYTLEFKQSSAKLAVETEQSIAQTARNLGFNENTLHGWIRKYVPQSLTLSQQTMASDLQEELKRLKKENERLKQERDILKKATAYFAKEVY